MNIPSWILYFGAVVCFWLGYGTAALLFINKRSSIDAEVLGDMGAKTKREYGEDVFQIPDPESEKIAISDILSEKKARTRKIKTPTNGTQKRVVKNV